MDAADLIASFATGTYTVTRRVRANFVAGRPVAGATSSFTVTACVQSANGRDLMRLPELRRSMDTCVIYTATELKVGAQNSANESDLIAIDGISWEIQHVEAWPQTRNLYWRCIAQAAG